MSAARIPKLDEIFPPGAAWANYEKSRSRSGSRGRRAAAEAAGRYIPPHARRAAAAAGAEEGNVRGDGAAMEIFTMEPVTRKNGTVIRGTWTKAIDPYGDYGGPYHDLRQLLDNKRFRDDMHDIYGALERGRSRSRSRGSRGSRRSRSRAHSRSRRGRSRSRSRGRGRGAGSTRRRSRSRA